MPYAHTRRASKKIHANLGIIFHKNKEKRLKMLIFNKE